VAIAEGAHFRGSVDMQRAGVRQVPPGFFSTAEARQPLYTKYVVVDPSHLKYRTYPASRPRQRALLNGDIIRMFGGLRVSDSFLMKSNVREMLFRKNPT
jgi:hypothetical protein